MRWAILLLFPLALLDGFAAQNGDSGFADVQNAARARTGADIRWNHDSPQDRQVDDHVHALMARQLSADHAVQIALLNNPPPPGTLRTAWHRTGRPRRRRTAAQPRLQRLAALAR